jgi:hypothetical protein
LATHVFISYSTKDTAITETICTALESTGTKCWVAPRDVGAEESWEEAVYQAIMHSGVFVLVYSSNVGHSRIIPKEIETALFANVPIIVVRVEEIDPRFQFDYSLRRSRWLDAFMPPIETHIRHLTESVNLLFSEVRGTRSKKGG